MNIWQDWQNYLKLAAEYNYTAEQHITKTIVLHGI